MNKKQMIYIAVLIFLLVMMTTGCDSDDTTSSDGDSDLDVTEAEADTYEQSDGEIEEAEEQEFEYPNDPKDWVGLPCDKKEYTCSLDMRISIRCDIKKGVYVSSNCDFVEAYGECYEDGTICSPEPGDMGEGCVPILRPEGWSCILYDPDGYGTCDENGICQPSDGDGDMDIESPEDNLL